MLLRPCVGLLGNIGEAHRLDLNEYADRFYSTALSSPLSFFAYAASSDRVLRSKHQPAPARQRTARWPATVTPAKGLKACYNHSDSVLGSACRSEHGLCSQAAATAVPLPQVAAAATAAAGCRQRTRCAAASYADAGGSNPR